MVPDTMQTADALELRIYNAASGKAYQDNARMNIALNLWNTSAVNRAPMP